MAEVVKTGLLAGEPLWELPTDELVRRCAAYKAAVCLRDPYERGERAVLNLGHTFAHALEAAGDYHGPSHGEAVALGLLAALRLSGLTRARSRRCSRRSRCASAATPPGPRSRATRSRSTARRGSCCSKRRAGR